MGTFTLQQYYSKMSIFNEALFKATPARKLFFSKQETYMFNE